jgi:hypothetical protein
MTTAEGPAPDPSPSESAVMKKLRRNSFTADEKIAEKINKGKRSGDPNVIAQKLRKDFLGTLYHKQGGRCFYTDIALDIHNFGLLQTASLQRVDSSKLHMHDNVVLICAALNEIDRTAVCDPAEKGLW